MSKNKSGVPEIMQIKGYKYRAQMLIGAVIILVIVLLIIVTIINGIASLFKGKDNSAEVDTATDTESLVSQSVENIPNAATVVSSETQSTDSSIETNKTEYKYDADNKLIIDTDTLDGKKAVALTFDDGPGKYTEKLINGLNERGAKGTFFMCGNCVEEYPEVVPMMLQGGHQIGNHTYNHANMTELTPEERNNQVQQTDDALNNICGQISTAFRPPYGSHNAQTDSEIHNKTITLWSLDTLDWQSRNAASVREVVVNNVWDGDIILFHDIYDSSVDGALMVVDELQQQGYVFVTVDELLSRYGYPIEEGVAHTSQFAVYETNSPYASQYQAEVEERQRKAEEARAASEAAGAFYTSSGSRSNADSSASAPSSDTSENTYEYNE